MVREIISTTLSTEDRAFCSEKGLKISELLSWAVNERKQQTGDLIEPTLNETKRRLKAFIELSNRYREFIDKNGLLDKWLFEEGVK